jgi:hypothetical protein
MGIAKIEVMGHDPQGFSQIRIMGFIPVHPVLTMRLPEGAADFKQSSNFFPRDFQ